MNSPNVACKIININFFAHIATNQYLFNKFYKIMIDTGVSKHSIASYKQFIAYIKDIKYTIIDISKASAIYF